MVNIEQAEQIAVDFVKKKKNVDKINVTKVTMGVDPAKPDDWEIQGSTADDSFIIVVSGAGDTVTSYEFHSKRPAYITP